MAKLRRQPNAPQLTGAPWGMPRGVIVLLGAAAAVITIAGMQAAASILAPLLFALMLAVAVHPMQEWAQRHGVPRAVGLVAAILTVYLVLLGLVAALVVSIAELVALLPRYESSLDDLLESARQLLARFGVDDARLQQELQAIDLDRVVSLLQAGLASAFSVVSALTLILALVLFMAYDGMGMRVRMQLLEAVRPDIAHALRSFASGTRTYLVVSTVFGLIVAVLDGLALWWLGIPLPLLWALLSFITNYIPNIGFVLGLVPPALLALLEGGVWQMVWVIAVYSVINFVIQEVIQPKFQGDAAGITVTVTFVSLVFWAWVLGPLGALLAIPLTLLLKALLLDIDPAARWVAVLVDVAPEAAGGVGLDHGAVPVRGAAASGAEQPPEAPDPDP